MPSFASNSMSLSILFMWSSRVLGFFLVFGEESHSNDLRCQHRHVKSRTRAHRCARVRFFMSEIPL